MTKKILMTLLVICLSIANGKGQVTVESMVDSNKILIGDVITYSVIIRHDANIKLDMPELAENLGQFELRDYESKEPVKKGGEIVERTDYEISTFESGEFEIPPLTIGYTLPNDSVRHTIKTEPILITVESLNPDDSGDIRDIKFPKTPPFNYARLFRNIGIGVLGVLFILGIVWIVMRRRRGEPILPSRKEPPRPAHDIALERLTMLKQSGLLENGHYKEYYTELSETLREYVGNRYFIHALEMTTLELIDHMKQESMNSDYIKRLHELLSVCDLVKFANFIPQEQEHERLLQEGFAFVHDTKISLSEPENEKTEKDPVTSEETADV